MSGLTDWLSGASGAANTAKGFYTDAAGNIISAYGSPAAAMVGAEQSAALRPQFAQQATTLNAQLAAQGLAPSGAGRAAMGNLGGQQAAALANVTAPLYQQALGQYGSIIGQMPGAEFGAYQNAQQQFMNEVAMAGEAAAGVPPMGMPGGSGSSGGGGPNYGPSNYYG